MPQILEFFLFLSSTVFREVQSLECLEVLEHCCGEGTVHKSAATRKTLKKLESLVPDSSIPQNFGCFGFD